MVGGRNFLIMLVSVAWLGSCNPDFAEQDSQPRVLSSSPSDGETEIPETAEVRITFSQSMDTQSGTITVIQAGTTIEPERQWLADDEGNRDRVLVLSPVGGFQQAAGISVFVDDDFLSTNGQALDQPWIFSFTILSDEIRPALVNVTPIEGAGSLGVNPPIVFTFSEAMDPAFGTLTLVPPDTILTPIWQSPTEMRVGFESPFEFETAYQLWLMGFRDPAGNLLDVQTGLLGDDLSFDFNTGIDTTAPTYTISPDFGVGPLAQDLPALIFTFSKEMDPNSGSIQLIPDPGFSLSWPDTDTLELTFTQPLSFGGTYSAFIQGFRDTTLIATHPATNLLEFTVEEDNSAPTVVGVTPAAGATQVPTDQPTLILEFSEAMDPSVGGLTLAPDHSLLGSATWTSASVLVVPLTGSLAAATMHTVSMNGFADEQGNALDAAASITNGSSWSFSTE